VLLLQDLCLAGTHADSHLLRPFANTVFACFSPLLKTPSEGCAPLATPTDQLTKAASRLATWDLFCWQLFTTGAAERFTAEEREWVLDQLLHLAMAFANRRRTLSSEVVSHGV
jgi:hypothetical protein